MRSYTHNVIPWTNGTAYLNADEYRVYHAIVDMIYLTEGPAPFGEKEMAARCNMPAARLRKAVAGLMTKKKIWMRGGCVYVLRVLYELQQTLPDRPAWDLIPVYDAELPLAPPAKVKAPKGEHVAFPGFWERRARRKGGDPRKPAADKFAALVASGVAPEAIDAGMKRHAAMLRSTGKLGTEFVPMTVTWLNQHGFADDAESDPKQNVVELDPAKFSNADWERVLRAYRVTNSWKTHMHGPEPGRAGCLVPDGLIEKRRIENG